MLTKQDVKLSLLAVAICTVALLTLSPMNSDNSTVLQCVARSTMISRGQDWVNKHVPYSQEKTYDGYRTDCSGFVSMCWQLGKPGLTTATLHTVSHDITKNDLQPGDAMNCPSHHVVLFAGWSDSSKTHYTAME